MTNIETARFVSAVTSFVGRPLDTYEIEQLLNAVPASAPAFDATNALYARNLLDALAGRRKIDAIKYFRSLTGDSLLGAKDAVESVMNRFN